MFNYNPFWAIKEIMLMCNNLSFAGLFLIVFMGGQIRAEVIFDNLGNTQNTGRNATSTTFQAQRFSFSSGQDMNLDSVTLYMSRSGSGNADISLWTGSTTSPTTLAFSSSSFSLVGSYSSSLSNTTFNATGITLTAGTNYWLSLGSSDLSTFTWGVTFNQTGSGSAFKITNVSSFNSGTSWSQNPDPFMLQINATSVPEPGTLLLGGIAACSGAAGAWWKRRKRKATQPETTDQPATA